MTRMANRVTISSACAKPCQYQDEERATGLTDIKVDERGVDNHVRLAVIFRGESVVGHRVIPDVRTLCVFTVSEWALK
jgi:hypothetical protein